MKTEKITVDDFVMFVDVTPKAIKSRNTIWFIVFKNKGFKKYVQFRTKKAAIAFFKKLNFWIKLEENLVADFDPIYSHSLEWIPNIPVELEFFKRNRTEVSI